MYPEAVESRFAALLSEYCLELRPGQTVVVEAQTPALPLIERLVPAALERGAYPLVLLEYPGQTRDLYRWGGEWLERIPPPRLALMEGADASLRILSAENPLEATDIDPARIAAQQKAWRPLSELRLQKRWCLTLYPTPGYAQGAGMGTAEFRAFVERALYLDRPDPVAAWRELAAFQAALIGRLEPVRELRLEAPGTDLRLRVTGRTWLNSDGKRNMPSGEVYTGPHEDSAEGEILFNLPATVSGQRVEGVYLRFQQGKVVEARAERGEEYLQRMLETDAGARFLGEIGLGTNYGIAQPSGIILYDEKIGGSVHLALGRSYPESGGTNVSAVHWDLVLDLRQGGRIWADGEVLQENGEFLGL
ncbi:aminopeptidase [Meiothermus granaticius NBRC 107808]|uniref:Aminopeptidase 2 n=1 Tax=Meiothermus granaticius NBRC 107808 TaxID=1227551 RepID=A0A399F7Q1_9DEIN|nr:Aminopeptidase 2 [Meiothermus granaticius NBRC 107808]GEM86255.1 aminopeptidase [Meiothermus granaticius NBRC 107808]